MKNYIIKFILIIAVINLIACDDSKKENTSNETHVEENENSVHISEKQFQNSKMKIGKVKLQAFHKGIVTNGFIDVPPANSAEVSAIMGGFIKSSPLLIGDEVKKGQLLLTIENPDFIEIQQEYLETYEKLSYLKSEFDRQKTLFDEQITSQKNYLKAESTYKSTVALFNGLEQKLRLLNLNPSKVKEGSITSVIPVYAPISGSITEVHTSVGKFMDASQVLLKIIDSSHKHLELVVFEKDVLRIKEGQTIEFKTPENSERIYNASVYLVGKSIDQKNRTVRVHGHLDNENEPFLVGMYVEAKIITYTANHLALPIEAFLEEDGRYYVLVLKEQHNGDFEFEKILVHIGLKNEAFIEIIDTDNKLQDADILIKGVFSPIDGDGGGHSH